MEHYKMYKAGKNWMVAGLMTTAVLAGLTLSNVNNTANANAATTAVAETSATPAQLSEASQQVSQASQNVTTAQNNLNDAQAQLNHAGKLNEGRSAVNSTSAALSHAQVASSAAAKKASDARTAQGNAFGTLVTASNAASDANSTVASLNPEKNIQINNSDVAKYQQQISDNNTELSSTEAKLSDERNTVKDIQAQVNAQSAVVDSLGVQLKKLQDAVAAADADVAKQKAQRELENFAENQFTPANGKLFSLNDSLKKAQKQVSQLKNRIAELKGSNNWLNNQITKKNVDTTWNQSKLNEASEANAALASAQANYYQLQAEAENAAAEAANAAQAVKNAYSAAVETRAAYNLPNSGELAKMSVAASNAAQAYSVAKSAADNDPAYQAYVQQSNVVATSEAALKSAIADQSDAQNAVSSANAAVTSAEAAVSAAQAAVDATEPGTAAAAGANGNLVEANAKLTAAQGIQRNMNAWLTDASESVNWRTAALNAANDLLASKKAAAQSTIDNLASKKAAADAAKTKLDQAKKNLEDSKDAQGAIAAAQANVDAAQAALTKAQGALKTAQENYDRLVNQTTSNSSDKYGNHLTNGGTTIYTKPAAQATANNASATANAAANDVVTTVVPAPTPAEVAGANVPVDAISSVVWTDPTFVNNAVAQGAGTYKTQVTVNWADGSTPTTIDWNLVVRDANSDNTNPGDNTNTDNNNTNNNTTTNGNQNTVNNGVVSGFTGINGNNYYVNGQQVTKAQYEAYVANKVQQNGAQATNAAALPQTGNENSAAIVALGAVSAMFGFGLAAKKREF